jgi:hypothetical protein
MPDIADVMTITLIGSKWQRNPPTQIADGDSTFTYTVNIFSRESKNKYIIGWCDCFIIKRSKGTADEQFNLNAWYMYILRTTHPRNAAEIERYERLICGTTIWAKFTDLALVTVNQSGFELPGLPLVPAEVTYKAGKGETQQVDSSSS